MAYNPFNLENKTILVTGASSGIGKATAIECSKMGAKVIVCGRDEARTNETLSLLEGNNHQAFIGDLVNQEDIERLVNSIDSVDGVALCAGRGLTLPFKFSTREKYDDVFNINFFSPIETLRLLTKQKKIKDSGSVVIIVSIGGTGRFSVGNGVYGSAKAALNSMIHFCSQELSSKLIRVNGINPGMIETPLIRKGTLTDEQLKEDQDKYPLKRYGKAEEIAYGAVYLLSDAAAWITGTSLVIDGGITTK